MLAFDQHHFSRGVRGWTNTCLLGPNFRLVNGGGVPSRRSMTPGVRVQVAKCEPPVPKIDQNSTAPGAARGEAKRVTDGSCALAMQGALFLKARKECKEQCSTF